MGHERFSSVAFLFIKFDLTGALVPETYFRGMHAVEQNAYSWSKSQTFRVAYMALKKHPLS